MNITKFDDLIKTIVQEKPSFSDKSLEQRLEEVLEILGSIENINYGGCGFAAYAIFLYLRKHNVLPEDFQIVYLNEDWCDYERDQYFTNKGFLEGKESKATSCNHAIVYLDEQFLDSTGQVDFSFLENNPYKLKVKPDVIDTFMQNSLAEPRDWNDCFNRKQYVPQIEEMLGIKFNVNV